MDVRAIDARKTRPLVGAGIGPVMFGATVMVVAIGLGIFYFAASSHTWPLFDDLRIYQDATRRLLAGGSWYLERQLTGPYPLMHGDVLYPPVLAWFIAPWLVLPAWTFVAVPVAILTWHVIDCRPAAWTWPLIALCVVFPTTLLYVVFANPSLWVAAFVALALRYRWPGVLVLLKPSLAPFAIIGIRSRGWWVGLAALGVLSLPVLAETLAYPSVVMDADGGGLLYSAQSVPLMLVPLLAWLGRATSPRAFRERWRKGPAEQRPLRHRGSSSRHPTVDLP